MAKKKFQYAHPGSLYETATYNYNGQEINVSTIGLCPDCRTPTVWVEDDLTVSRIYHDPTCIQVKLGTGHVAPRRRSSGSLPRREVIGYEEHERRRREQGYA